MSNRQLPIALKLLISARNLIENPDNWCKGVNYRKRSRRDGTPYKAFCSIGAVHEAANSLPPRLSDYAVVNACNILAQHMNSNITYYNDNNTHSEVLRVWNLAISSNLETSNVKLEV